MFAGGCDKTAMVGVAVVGGLAVGAALAILFAPKKGTELREDISDGGQRFSGTLSELMDALKAKFSGGQNLESEPVHSENVVAHARFAGKKPKSDIKELIHEAHIESNPEGQIG